MPLNCRYDPGDYLDYDEWHHGPTGDYYTIMPKLKRRKRCASCGKLIAAGATCTEFLISRAPRSGIEYSIYGDGENGVPKASRWLCESCSDIYFSLDDLGFDVGPYEDLRETLKDYQAIKRSEK